jgi:hypothetical protein
MPTPTLKTAEALDAAWQVAGGASIERAAAGGAGRVDSSTAAAPSARRSSWSRVFRVARDVAIGMALIAALPLTAIGVAGRAVLMTDNRMAERITSANVLRELRAPVELSITPQVAGAALHRLRPVVSSNGFVARPTSPPDAPWTANRLTALQFVALQSKWWNGPDAKQIITAAAKGLPEADRAWLAQLAKAGVWRDFDVVTAAREVDVLGQSFVTPFADDVNLFRMPRPDFRNTRALAHAGVARAAYYASIGDPGRAEQVLRSVVSLGFIFIDDGFSALDALTGRMIVEVGRDGLQQLYHTGYHRDQLASVEWSAPPTRQPNATTRGKWVAQLQTDAIAHLDDPSLPRTVRLADLEHLRWAGCSSLPMVLFGPPSNVEEAVARARPSLARTDAERAYLDLLEHGFEHGPPQENRGRFAFSVLQGAASLTSAATGNPRIAGCTNAIMGMF